MIGRRQRTSILAILAITQVLSWGALYYAFSILAPDIQREMGWRAEAVYGAFSLSLLVAGLCATPVGILLDRCGGRFIMAAGSLICGAGFIGLGTAHSLAMYFVATSVLGIGMAMVLYEAAFATINREFDAASRAGISTLTLFGGLASTVFWPVTLKLNALLGWRDTYLAYGVIQLAICLPLHLLLPGTLKARPPRPAPSAASERATDFTLRQALNDATFWKLAFAFSANSFTFSALSVHLIPLLGRMGHTAATAVFLGALIGPMQVIGRIGELAVARRARPQSVGLFAFAMLPAALLALVGFGMQVPAVGVFCIFYGLGNGILTIVRGTVPQALYGRENYGAISGAMAGPALAAKAAGPLVIAVLVQWTPAAEPVLWMLLAFSIASLGFYVSAVRKAKPSILQSPA